MDPRARRLWSTLGAVSLLVGMATASLSASQGNDGTRWVRAGASGARARNFQDPQGLIVRDVPPGELMRVHGEDVGFLDVEVASGLQVWVYGEFLEEEPLQDGTTVLRVTTSRVNMRPRPGASTAHMPIRTKLNLGDRVRLIERSDPSKPLTEDWVKVWSPRSARAWVRATETEPVSDASGAASEWRRSEPKLAAPLRAAGGAGAPLAAGAAGAAAASGAQGSQTAAPTREASAPASSAATTPRATGTAATSGDAAVALAEADRLYEAARAQEMGDYAPVVAAYQRVLALAPAGSTTAELAQRRVQEAEVRMNYVDLKRQVAAESAAAEERQAEISAAGEARELANTQNWGRFDTRGWVTKGKLRGEEHYIIEWGGDVVAEIVCSSGRYDLSIFDGFEVGVVGRTIDEARISGGLIGYPAVVDVQSLEVISGSGVRGGK